MDGMSKDGHNARRWQAWQGLALIAWFALLVGCAGERTQSSLHPAGPAAALIAELWWFMFAVLSAVFVLVMSIAAWAVFRRRMDPAKGPAVGNRFIAAGGIALPSVVLLAMLIYSLSTTLSLRMPETKLTIEVVGYKWWWDVRYPDQGLVTANEIYVPVGEPVRLELTSNDVVHSFWVPQLHGKVDMLPGQVNALWIQADEPGVFRGQCAEYCGRQHARMAFHVVALEREAFDAWVAERQPDPAEPATGELQRGRDVFFAAGCNACHAIRGTDADADTGPDLTHFGSRMSIGAGQWPNTAGGLAGWISNPQALKPGNLMPRSYLEPDDLHAIVEYLRSLE